MLSVVSVHPFVSTLAFEPTFDLNFCMRMGHNHTLPEIESWVGLARIVTRSV